MDFSKLKHRIIFLRPTDITQNSMGETIPRYKAFKPHIKLPFTVSQDDVYLSHNEDGNAVLVESSGRVYAHKLSIREFSVAGLVAAMSGREYEESQKIRAETTYKISTRFFPGITSDMHILHNGREFEIISVIDLNAKGEELEIVAIESARKTDQSYRGDTDG